METLIIIDEQNDFCNPSGSLYVKGAESAVLETVKYIEENNPEQIIVTLDTHSPLHMGLPGSWNREFNDLPCFNPYPGDSRYNLRDYYEELEEKGLPFVVWPNHCLKGTWGHSLHPDLSQALTKWIIKNGEDVIFIEKGQNNLTEMYSAFSELGSEDIVLPKIDGDKVTMVGVALDYCVKYSFLDLRKKKVPVALYLPGTARIGEVEEYWKE